MPLHLLVFDDERSRCEDTRRAIIAGGIPEEQIEVRHPDRLTADLSKFIDTIKAFHEEIPKNRARALKASQFDAFDIIFLDNNLANLKIPGARLTAESIAGYIRAYSAKSPYIVSLNKNPEVDFDLRYLVGDYSTVADLALNTNHLSNHALWTGAPDHNEQGFRPWYWPSLVREAGRRPAQIAFVKENFDKPVFEALGIPTEVAGYMSRHATGALSSESPFETSIDDAVFPDHPVAGVTFADFFLSRNRSIPVKEDREHLIDQASSKTEVSEACREVISRAVAADIDLWIRRDLIAPQDAFVDLPHLLVRMPFLLGRKASRLADWNRSLEISGEPYGLVGSTYRTHLKSALFNSDLWGPTPTFAWPALRDNEYLNQLFFDSTANWADVVFCEDISKFHARTPEHGKAPVAFEAEFEGAWTQRYVAQLDNIGYVPKSRLAK